MENVEDDDVVVRAKEAGVDRKESQDYRVHVKERSDHDHVFQDQCYIPFGVSELQHGHDSVEEDEAQLDEGHHNHPRCELVILDHLVEGQLLLDGHPVVEGEDVDKDDQLNGHHQCGVVVSKLTFILAKQVLKKSGRCLFGFIEEGVQSLSLLFLILVFFIWVDNVANQSNMHTLHFSSRFVIESRYLQNQALYHNKKHQEVLDNNRCAIWPDQNELQSITWTQDLDLKGVFKKNWW